MLIQRLFNMKICKKIIQSGSNKGNRCSNAAKFGNYCGLHNKKLSSTSEPILHLKDKSLSTNSDTKPKRNNIKPVKEYRLILKQVCNELNEKIVTHPDIIQIYSYRIIVINLLKIEQPPQRSEKWYKMRESRITASDAASCLTVTPKDLEREKKGILRLKAKLGKCCNPYKSRKEFIINKCRPGDFTGNVATKWGQKYETIGNFIYEKRHNSKVLEFGLLPHPTYSWLGASPDGITPDGIMLEIKCPYSDRELGPPFNYYWIQIQLQLETCDLDLCDFLECKFSEYRTEAEYLADGGNSPYTANRLEKGKIIKIITIRDDDSKDISYVYPPLGEPKDIDQWIKNWIINDTATHPFEYFNHKRYGQIEYWKLVGESCIRIKRDREWFAESLPELEKCWNDVLYYRKYTEEFEKLFKAKPPSISIDINTDSNNFTELCTGKSCLITLDD